MKNHNPTTELLAEKSVPATIAVGKPENVVEAVSAKVILKIFRSLEFRTELEELSSYAAHIKQERPIVHLLAKYFWRQGRNVVLEDRRCDLVVEGTKIEFKYHFDCDQASMKKELEMCGGEIASLNACKKNGWQACRSIYDDTVIKCPHIFILIICSRDLSKVKQECLSQIVWSGPQLKYNRSVPYDPQGKHLGIATGFLGKINKIRPFSFHMASVQTIGSFPSTYHLLAYEFKRPVRLLKRPAESYDHIVGS